MNRNLKVYGLYFLAGAFGWYETFVAAEQLPCVLNRWVEVPLLGLAIWGGFWAFMKVGEDCEAVIRRRMPDSSLVGHYQMREAKRERVIKIIFWVTILWVLPLFLGLINGLSAHYE